MGPLSLTLQKHESRWEYCELWRADRLGNIDEVDKFLQVYKVPKLTPEKQKI